MKVKSIANRNPPQRIHYSIIRQYRLGTNPKTKVLAENLDHRSCKVNQGSNLKNACCKLYTSSKFEMVMSERACRSLIVRTRPKCCKTDRMVHLHFLDRVTGSWENQIWVKHRWWTEPQASFHVPFIKFHQWLESSRKKWIDKIKVGEGGATRSK